MPLAHFFLFPALSGRDRVTLKKLQVTTSVFFLRASTRAARLRSVWHRFVSALIRRDSGFNAMVNRIFEYLSERDHDLLANCLRGMKLLLRKILFSLLLLHVRLSSVLVLLTILLSMPHDCRVLLPAQTPRFWLCISLVVID